MHLKLFSLSLYPPTNGTAPYKWGHCLQAYRQMSPVYAPPLYPASVHVPWPAFCSETKPIEDNPTIIFQLDKPYTNGNTLICEPSEYTS